MTLRLAPSVDGPVGPSFFVISNLFFVFAETDTHLLLGVAFNFDPARPTAVVKGWAAKRTRRAVGTRGSRWNGTGRPPPSVPRGRLRYREGVRGVLGGAAAESGVSFFELRLPDKTTPPMAYNEPRYAVLRKLEEDLATQNELYKVGWVGKFSAPRS